MIRNYGEVRTSERRLIPARWHRIIGGTGRYAGNVVYPPLIFSSIHNAGFLDHRSVSASGYGYDCECKYE
jgi:hypothetical protein